ncbi:hypothetical protein [Agaribacter flavus]|uniref:Solute-binding protein family 3/N-terminal domain-containing protein n=1 Tax=Agaribacter flavus TaxID=1902781 RepID=A0ABV7FQ69_9ALTE
MRLTCIICLSFSLSLFFPSASPAKENDSNAYQLKVAMHTGSFIAYELSSMNKPCKQLKLFKDKPNHRMAIELLIMCEAFEAADFEVHMQVSPTPNYYRALRDTNDGRYHTIAESIWSASLDNYHALHVTQDVVRFGEFEKGVYTSDQHPLQQAKHNTDIDLKQYTSVTFRHWEHDYNILRQISGQVLTTIKFDSLLKMLHAQRADFSIIEFPIEDSLQFTFAGVTTLPIQGIKVKMYDSRVFVISKKTQNSDTIFNALNRGLSIMRKEKRIAPHYIRQGLINHRVKDWKVINSPPEKHIKPL